MGGARQILLTAIVLLACNRGLWAQSHIEWVGSWAEAQALAARHQRLVLIHFWSPDCAPCLKLERSVFNQPEFIRAVATNYVPWKVNVAENPAVARDFGVDRWPTDVVLAAAGQELYRGASPVDANRYIATLDQIAAHARLGMPAGVSPARMRRSSSTGNGVNRGSAFPATSCRRLGLSASDWLSACRLSTVRRVRQTARPTPPRRDNLARQLPQSPGQSRISGRPSRNPPTARPPLAEQRRRLAYVALSVASSSGRGRTPHRNVRRG